MPVTPVAADKIAKVDPVWSGLRLDAETIARDEPALSSFVHSSILNHERLEGALSYHLAAKLGSADISEAGGRVIDAIAEVLRECGELPFEVAGHTDSQGRAETNRNLSQARAEAVINALLARRVLVASLVARGYGADRPIADNSTEAGREANRRIEFTLIRPEPEPEPFDPALEAQLVFEPRTPDADTVRPRQRPGSALPQDVEPTIGSGDDDHDHDHDQ